MSPYKLTLGILTRAIGAEPPMWEGQCFALAVAAAEIIGGKAVAVYGHWTGRVSPDGFWRDHVGVPFVQHGWVNLPNGDVCDPTRWSFEGVDPYIYVGPADHYDEGGNAWREAMMRPPPKRGDTWMRRSEVITLGMSIPAARHLSLMIGVTECDVVAGGISMTTDQAFWTANVPLHLLHVYAFEVYEAITKHPKCGSAWVPIDNQRTAERTAGVETGTLSALG